MRHFRLLPLLVMACAAPAAADDHRVDYSAMFTLCSGSTIKGVQFSHAGEDLTPSPLSRATSNLIGVIDVGGNFWGSDDSGHETDRATALYGIRGTWALGREHAPLKLIAGAMVGPVYSNVDGTGQLGFGFAPGVGLEVVSKYFSNDGAIGVRAYVEGIAVGGDGDSFWRFSIGGVWRIKDPRP